MNQFEKHLEISKEGFAALERVIAFSCSRCGLCASMCPKGSIEMRDTIPTLVGECNKCGFCYQACPRAFFPMTKAQQRWFGPEITEIDRRVGRCVERFTSRALNDEVFDKAATGGTATALTRHLLDKKIVDAVLQLEAVHQDQFFCHHGRAVVATTAEETQRCSRSKNQITPILHELKKVAGYEKFAVVGLSCHVEGLRKLQLIKDDPELREMFTGPAKIGDRLLAGLKYVIAINCFSATKSGGIDLMLKKMGIREADIIKYAEDTKKSLYQVLNEGKNFLWFVQDNIITKDGKFFPFKYIDYLDEVITMGCMACPSFIVCKQADVSIGVTASETKLSEFGYNSVMVRNSELSAVFSAMAQEQALLKRPMWDNRGTLLRKFVERVLPSKDLMNFAEYVRTGSWKPHDDLYKRSESVQGGKILGLQRLLIAQTVKRKMMHEPAIRALQKEGKHFPEMI